jgi:hypothetical protein
MNAKRILPWKEADEHFYRAHVCMIAETSIGAYAIIDRGKYVNKFAWILEEAEWEYSKVYRYVDTIDAAMDACEADYIERCSEFLRVAGLGDVVVPIKVAIDAHDTVISSRHFWVKFADMLARFDNAINGLSAAIDAASKE